MLPTPTSHSPALGPGCAGPTLAFASASVRSDSMHPSAQHPTCGSEPFMVDPSAAAAQGPRRHTECVLCPLPSMLLSLAESLPGVYCFSDKTSLQLQERFTYVVLLRSTPYVTGTSVLGITYKDGVMLAADTLGAVTCCTLLRAPVAACLPQQLQGCPSYPTCAGRWCCRLLRLHKALQVL